MEINSRNRKNSLWTSKNCSLQNVCTPIGLYISIREIQWHKNHFNLTMYVKDMNF